jgi:hypothetical protein
MVSGFGMSFHTVGTGTGTYLHLFSCWPFLFNNKGLLFLQEILRIPKDENSTTVIKSSSTL